MDGVIINNQDMSIIPHDYLFEYKQKDIDETTKQMDGYDKDYPPNLSGKTKQNALRHMYIESKVAKFLTKIKTSMTM